ncbi:GntR family transcriptional regulator [Burkholderia gladioli]|uniref:GntR family transcriptional regulator n=1 Tax=Burkholderia gladioli TaxID=28095 RepID=UPI0016404A74|nr:GntR family transcriptional regulator [Burkholderia gladioli]
MTMQDLSEPPGSSPARSPSSGKLVRSTTVDLALEAIRGKILRGELPPGAPLRQEALAEELGVSRVPVREAITRLQGEGFVTIIPHKGAYVCAISADEVRETFEAARALVLQMDEATETTWGQLNWRFHETLYAPSGLDLAIETLRRLNDRNERYFRFQVVNVPIREHTRREHLEMIELSRARDVRGGAALLREHLQHAMRDIVGVAERLLAPRGA